MGRLAKLKREIILESNKRLLGETKSYLTEEEKEKMKLPFIKLVTKYKDGLKGFIEKLNTVVSDEKQFCANPKEAAKQAAESLDDFITRMSLDMKVKPEQVLEALYDKANGGLLQTVLSVAKPLVSKFGGGLLSKEILDEIEQHMRTKYGAVGRGINSMMTEIMSKLGVTVDDICK
tara:strand:- start:467 stop:994 length:528 start_codon:yes stop_codon:yes gene_type:complete